MPEASAPWAHGCFTNMNKNVEITIFFCYTSIWDPERPDIYMVLGGVGREENAGETREP